MKKTLSAFMLGMVSIVMVSCSGNGNTNSSRPQNVNIQVSESTAKWELIGSVSSYEPQGGMGLGRDVNDKYGYIYAKQIAGETHYRVIMGRELDSPIYNNPNYGSTNYGEYGRYKYCFDHMGKTFYINF
jgi:hypothetical protein